MVNPNFSRKLTERPHAYQPVPHKILNSSTAILQHIQAIDLAVMNHKRNQIIESTSQKSHTAIVHPGHQHHVKTLLQHQHSANYFTRIHDRQFKLSLGFTAAHLTN